MTMQGKGAKQQASPIRKSYWLYIRLRSFYNNYKQKFLPNTLTNLTSTFDLTTLKVQRA